MYMLLGPLGFFSMEALQVGRDLPIARGNGNLLLENVVVIDMYLLQRFLVP